MNLYEQIETNVSNELKKENLQFNDTTHPKVFRQYISPDVYVESPQQSKSSSKQSIGMLNNCSGDHGFQRHVKVKLCSCLTNPSQCPCHPKTTIDLHEDVDHGRGDCIRERNRSEICLRTTCADETCDKSDDDMNSSIPTTSTVVLREFEGNEDSKDEAFRRWCAKKMYTKKLQQQREMLQKELEERVKANERKKQVEQERENFRRWLIKKKHEEEIRKKEEQKRLDEERIKNVYKEEKRAENKIRYELWLKMKEQVYLDKKIEEKHKQIAMEEDKQKRLEYNAKAYEEWLKASHKKQKPIPLNQGLDSLRSSVSVTYINPIPWNPNIEGQSKPSSV